MSDLERRNISADLRRISWWLQTGNLKLAEQFIERFRFGTQSEAIKFGKRSLGEWIKAISDQDKDLDKRSESALTLSILMK